MIRALSKLLLLLAVTAQSLTNATVPGPEAVELIRKVIRFEDHYNRFFRKLFGCPLDPKVMADDKTCRFPVVSVVDLRDFEAARLAAMELFSLSEGCKK